jgi:hypothetical protein
MRIKHETIITHCVPWRIPMKRILFLVPAMLLLYLNAASAGTFVSGSTGADGAFNPTANTVLQLPPNGMFNFTTVNIPSGVTITFKKNAANTPVYILATGDVTIAGTIDVSGGSTTSSTDNQPGIGGPGGFDGGYGDIIGISDGAGGKGLGPGGGSGAPIGGYSGGGGGFGTAGQTGNGNALGGSTYGNARLLPLIGGSGGGGIGGVGLGYGGGGGGGAILIASSGNIKISGTIYAYGGSGRSYNFFTWAGGGSGGAIKLMANTISGSGYLYASGSSGCSGCNSAGGFGRIRIEVFTNNYASATSPPYSYGLPGSVFVANTPSLSITSIGGSTIPANPTASYSSPDITLPNTTTNPITATLAAANIPVGTVVTLSVMPQFGTATKVDVTLGGTDASSTATASINLPTDSATIIMAYTTYTMQTAMFYDGEKIDRVRVASSMGGKSEAIYLTESGKEIKAEKLMLAGLLR